MDATLLVAEPGAAAARAAALEQQGFDGVFTFEGPHDPFLPLAVAAAATRRVRLGTAVAIAFARNPMVCAYQAHDLQLLSRGRFVLGLGSQVRAHIERRFGERWSHPHARMREYVRALRAIWKCWNEGAPLRFEGRFYRHTLMPPLFRPRPSPWGPPPIHLAGFGPRMIRVAGEVADGWIAHPFHSRRYLEEVALPALRAGARRAGRPEGGVAVACQLIAACGDSDGPLARARAAARAQIAFYAATPAYRVFLEHHGWGHLQEALQELVRAGRWEQLPQRLPEEVVEAVAVCGRPGELGARIRARVPPGARVMLVLYNEAGPEAAAEIVRGLRGG